MSQNGELERYRAPALDKGLDILEVLATSESGMSQAEIAKALGRSPNEIYRMLDRLVRRDYVLRTAEDRYTLTLKLFELAHSTPPLRRLAVQAMPVMREFALLTDQSCHLVVYDRGAVVIAQVDSPGYWSVAIRVGARVGLVDTGSGHVLLAFAPAEERRLMLTEHDIAVPPDFDGRLSEIRGRGYERMRSLQIPGVTNLSCPILGPAGSVIAVLTCPFTKRLDKPEAPDEDATLDHLRAACAEISRRRGIEDEDERAGRSLESSRSKSPPEVSP